MKFKPLRQLLNMSKYALYGMVLQCFFFSILFANEGSAQKYKNIKEVYVTIDFDNDDLLSAFTKIESVSDLHFAFNKNDLQRDIKLNKSYKNKSIYEILLNISQETRLRFQQVNHVINVSAISGKKANQQERVEVNLQSFTIKGKVTDENDEPLPGVTIIVKGTNIGTTTDMEGNYALNVPDAESTLVFSFIGFTLREVPVNGRNTINVVLQEDAQQLDEVVVVGFGEQKKANLTGAVTTVDAKVLESRPVQNMSQMLQGVIPGLNFQTGGLGGELNQGLNFNIRGAGTIGSGSNASPLILIDGMEANLNAINPQDVESVTVLKDAAASAVYGSRAAFGVVLITTKSGSVGKANVNYNNNFRFTSPLGLPTMMDSHNFALYWNEAAANDGEGPKFSQEVIDRIIQFQNGEIDHGTVPNANGDRYQYYAGSHANTDWFKEHYKNSAFSQDHNLSVSGGTDKSTYYASANYLDQGGLSRYAGDNFNRYALAGKINTKVNDYIRFNYNTRFVREDYTKATHQSSLFYHNIARRWPTVPARDPNGHFTDPGEIAQLVEGGRTNDQQDRLFLQGKLIITPIKNWNIYASGNYSITNRNYHSDVLPAYSYDVEENPFPVSVGWNSPGYTYVYEYNRKNDFITSNIYSDYVFDLNEEHNFKVMAGFNSELNQFRTIGASRSGLITPTLPTISTATDNSRATEGQYQHWATAGFFGRLTYDYKEKYLLELNARYDGTSRFTRDKRWNLFPSISAGWNIANEGFWKWDDVVQLFKIRGSYGELGNQNTSNWYPFYPTMPVGVNNGWWLINGERPNTAHAPDLISSLLTWERVQSWNIGFDLAVINHKLNVNFDYYNRKTIDMVGPAPELPVILGTNVPQINNADMQSYGFELELNWKDRIGDLSYNIRGVLSDDQQEIISYPNPTNNIGNWYNGRKMGEIWGYTTVGIAKTDEEMDAHLETAKPTFGSNWQAGDIMYADLNQDNEVNGGSGVLGETGDRSIIGNSTPRFRFGLDLTGNYKNFDLRVFVQGVGKRDWMPNGPYFWGASGGMWQSAGFVEHMDFFRDQDSPMVQAGLAEVNLDSYFPRPYFNQGGKNQQTQTRYLQSAAYMRIKNIQVGYSLPQSVLSAVGISKVRLYLSGENLFTFTKLTKIFDPETVGLSGWSDGKTYPLAKVVSFGANINF
jgi:TonB-linked SusC/RagA family outer membrane protein